MLNIIHTKDYLALIGEVFSDGKVTSQEKFIERLKKFGFSFVPWDYLKYELGIDLPLEHRRPYLIKKVKHSKFPKKDEYDTSFMVGLDYEKRIHTEIYIYVNKQFLLQESLPWEKSTINFKVKKDPTIFPSYLSHQERKKWRRERQRYISSGVASSYYTEHLEAVKNLNPNMAI